MIQRIQTIFYFLAGVCFGALFQFPFATSEKPIPQYLADQEYNIMDSGVLMALVIVGIVVSLIAIFLYRKRGTQLKLGYLIITISILVPLVAFLLIYTEDTAVRSTDVINDRFGLYLPVLALLFGAIANRFVKKDDKLVKSMDRLR